MTNTQTRIAAIYSAADTAGLPLEVKQGLWQQLAGLTPEGRDSLLTRWEATATTWPTGPADREVCEAVAAVEWVI